MNIKKIASIATIVAAFGLVACDDSTSASNDNNPVPSSSVSSIESSDDAISSSSDVAEPESSDANDDAISSSSEVAEPESSSSEEPAEESSSSLELEVSCNIDYDSDIWSFETKGTYEDDEMAFDIAANGSVTFEGNSATTEIAMNLDTGSPFVCAMMMGFFGGDLASSLPPGIELPEDVEINMEQDENAPKVECDGSVLKMTYVEVEEELTEEKKKEAYANIVSTCKDLEAGNFDEFFGKDEDVD